MTRWKLDFGHTPRCKAQGERKVFYFFYDFVRQIERVMDASRHCNITVEGNSALGGARDVPRTKDQSGKD
jgi:hypothetical protein